MLAGSEPVNVPPARPGECSKSCMSISRLVYPTSASLNISISEMKEGSRKTDRRRVIIVSPLAASVRLPDSASYNISVRVRAAYSGEAERWAYSAASSPMTAESKREPSWGLLLRSVPSWTKPMRSNRERAAMLYSGMSTHTR